MREIIKKKHRFTAESIDKSIILFGSNWAGEFEGVLSNLFIELNSLEHAIRGYSKFALNSMRMQAQFEREGSYRSKSYKEVANEIYLNEQYMAEEYLPGLFLSHFLWPHHYRQIQFYKNAFIGMMKVLDAKSFVEVGVGTGVYSYFALQAMPEILGFGFDISPASKKFADYMMKQCGFSSRYQVDLSDISEGAHKNKTDWLICVEVLEHLENPISFLSALRATLNPGGYAFITAAINAAHSDHIYLYRNALEVSDHLMRAGFSIEQIFIGAAYPPQVARPVVPEVAAFIVKNG
jgi:2-polyprenyl-3-methyl-5-hydroxy-6-metoxy-1,4-benzoquinol methylase